MRCFFYLFFPESFVQNASGAAGSRATSHVSRPRVHGRGLILVERPVTPCRWPHCTCRTSDRDVRLSAPRLTLRPASQPAVRAVVFAGAFVLWVLCARARVFVVVCVLFFGDCVLCARCRHAAAIRCCEFLTFCVCDGFLLANSFPRLPSSDDDDQPSLRIWWRANISRWGSAERSCWPSSSRSPQTVRFPYTITTGKSFLNSSLSLARDQTRRARARSLDRFSNVPKCGAQRLHKTRNVIFWTKKKKTSLNQHRIRCRRPVHGWNETAWFNCFCFFLSMYSRSHGQEVPFVSATNRGEREWVTNVIDQMGAFCSDAHQTFVDSYTLPSSRNKLVLYPTAIRSNRGVPSDFSPTSDSIDCPRD